MIKEAINLILDLSEPKRIICNDLDFYSKEIHLPPTLEAPEFKTSTLTSVLDYLKSFEAKKHDNLIVYISGPQAVSIVTPYDDYHNRESFLTAVATTNSFRFNEYYDPESFLIMLQTSFIQTPERDLLTKVSSTVATGNVTSNEDNGISQTLQVKKSIALKSDQKIENPISLQPYRTFREIEQPVAKYVFRAKERGEDRLPQFALFDVEDDSWKLKAIETIRAYLVENLTAPKYTAPEGWNFPLIIG